MSETGFMKGMSGHQRSNPITDEWLTPPEILKALGPFELDPCATCGQAHDGFKPWTAAMVQFCKCSDGLSQKWHGMVWLNPPYGKKIGAWMAKLAKHKKGIALVFARTETGWFQDCVFRTATSLFFVMGRIRFYKPDGTPGGYTGGAPSVFVAYGKEASDRIENLQMPGRFVRLWKKGAM